MELDDIMRISSAAGIDVMPSPPPGNFGVRPDSKSLLRVLQLFEDIEKRHSVRFSELQAGEISAGGGFQEALSLARRRIGEIQVRFSDRDMDYVAPLAIRYLQRVYAEMEKVLE